jgi:hypothetical protein
VQGSRSLDLLRPRRSRLWNVWNLLAEIASGAQHGWCQNRYTAVPARQGGLQVAPQRSSQSISSLYFYPDVNRLLSCISCLPQAWRQCFWWCRGACKRACGAVPALPQFPALSSPVCPSPRAIAAPIVATVTTMVTATRSIWWFLLSPSVQSIECLRGLSAWTVCVDCLRGLCRR